MVSILVALSTTQSSDQRTLNFSWRHKIRLVVPGCSGGIDDFPNRHESLMKSDA